MDLGDILAELEKNPDDARWLRALGAALGVELSRRRLDELATVVRGLSRGQRQTAGSFAAGYAAALQDVAIAFQAELGAEVEDAEVARLAQQSPYIEALGALAAGNQTVTAIGVAMGKTKSSASRALAVLREVGLVTDYAAAGPGGGDERARPHALTPRGRRIVEQIAQQRGRAARRRTPVRGARIGGAFTSLKRR